MASCRNPSPCFWYSTDSAGFSGCSQSSSDPPFLADVALSRLLICLLVWPFLGLISAAQTTNQGEQACISLSFPEDPRKYLKACAPGAFRPRSALSVWPLGAVFKATSWSTVSPTTVPCSPWLTPLLVLPSLQECVHREWRQTSETLILWVCPSARGGRYRAPGHFSLPLDPECCTDISSVEPRRARP